MNELILDALFDSLKMLPFLFAVYLFIELLEYRFGQKLRSKVAHAKRYGPLIGAMLGLFPQCGFSVIGASLYVRRLVTIGTMVAIFLATSDEAIPVILAQPGHMHLLAPLLGVKFVIAVVTGYVLDLLIFKNQQLAEHQNSAHHDCPDCETVVVEEHGCCGHHVSEGKKKFELILHPVKHTMSVFVFIFAVTILLNLIIDRVGEEHLSDFLLGNSLLQPVFAALVGLIPSCAASVAITQVYIAGGIGFGSAIAGLSASGGIGLLVLIRETKSLKQTLKIIGILFAVSALSGVIIQLFVS